MLKKEVVLETKDLCKDFGAIKAVNEVNMKLYKNEIVAIVGDNGAGKSTLIKIISGIYPRDRGEIYLNGKKVIINNPADAKKLGIETVYQEKGIIPEFNAAQNLFLGREKLVNNGLAKFFKYMDETYMKKETIKLLKNIGITLKNVNTKINNLSGGQRQTVVVGRAVYWGGKILIFDEPTNNLGAIQEKKVINLIKTIRKQYNLSIIIISHNISHVFELVDRIIVLRNGEVIGERIKSKTNPNEIVSMITGIAA